MLEVIEVEISDLEEFIELSKENSSELDEIKNQLIDTEQKIIDLEEESLYSEEFDNPVSYTHLTLPTSHCV